MSFQTTRDSLMAIQRVYRRWEKMLARRVEAIEREHDRSAAFAEATMPTPEYLR